MRIVIDIFVRSKGNRGALCRLMLFFKFYINKHLNLFGHSNERLFNLLYIFIYRSGYIRHRIYSGWMVIDRYECAAISKSFSSSAVLCDDNFHAASKTWNWTPITERVENETSQSNGYFIVVLLHPWCVKTLSLTLNDSENKNGKGSEWDEYIGGLFGLF